MKTIFKFAPALLLIVSLIALGTTFAQDQSATPASADAAPAMQSRWPMHVPTADGEIIIFQPQLDDFQGDTLTARAAVSITSSKQQNPIFGAVWLKSRVSTDRVARTVQVLDVDVTRTRFPNVDDATEKSLTGSIKQAITAQPITLSLDQLLAMVGTVEQEKAAAADLKIDAPKIIFRDHPAIKIQYDGAPRSSAADNSTSGILRAVNTPFFIALDPASKKYFLKGAGVWFAAPDPMGPFAHLDAPPPAIAQLADAENYKDPEKALSPAQAAAIEIITATEPTELIWTDGPAQMSPIENTGLLYVANTDSDVFLTIDNQQQYVLLSGRWFTAPSRNGPWTFVASDKLPEDFKHIPPNSDKVDVLAQVGGTDQAQDAVADTYVPQTASVDRKQFEQPAVEYDGDPQFEAVPEADCSYAVNTAEPVVLVHDHYYCCHDAVWYSAGAARGPWDLCVSVPGEVYRLPPSCPIYSVRYCYVYGYTPDLVYVGYTPGYVGCYPFNHVVVYGTGYHYQPWVGRAFYARPVTFGYAAHYNSYVGHWGFSFALATGGGGAWIGERRDVVVHREPWFGYGGYRPVVVHRDVNVNIFRRSYVDRVHEIQNDRVAQADVNHDRYFRNVYDRRNDVRDFRPDSHGQPRADVHDDRAHAPAVGADHRDDAKREDVGHENVFTDHQGAVFRRTANGWERRDQNDWKPEEHQGNPNDAHHDAPAAQNDHHDATPAQPPRENDRGSAHDANDHNDQHADDHDAADHARGPAHDPGAAQPSHAPAAGEHQGDLDRDYHARESGNDRLHNYEHSAAPADNNGGAGANNHAAHADAPHAGSAAPADRGHGR